VKSRLGKTRSDMLGNRRRFDFPLLFRQRFLFLIASGIMAFATQARADIIQSITITQPPDATSLETVSTFAQAWMNSFSNLSSFSFAGYGNDAFDVNYPLGLSIDGVVFTGTDGYLYVRQEAAAFDYGSDFLYGPPETEGGITITLPPNVYAIGWSWGNFYDVIGTTIRLSDGETFIGNGIFGFVGFESTNPIRSVEISSPSFPLIYDEFSFVKAAPEPVMWYPVFGIGIALAALRARKRRG
jgi:hypothetical protein